MFFPKSDLKQKCQDAYKQSSGVGMHQNPHFQLKPIKNQKNPEINPRSTIEMVDLVRSTIAIPESARRLVGLPGPAWLAGLTGLEDWSWRLASSTL